jgi:hypothetical protein
VAASAGVAMRRPTQRLQQERALYVSVGVDRRK